MKSFLLYVFICISTLVSCKNEEQKEQSKLEQPKLEKEALNIIEGFEISTTVTGEFMYSDSQAALDRDGIIYGVIMNDKAEELLEKAKKINPDPYASFDVTLDVTIFEIDNKDLWPQVIEIHKIIEVERSSSDDSLMLNKQE